LDDDETISENREIMSKIPFAIVGSNTAVKTKDGRIVRAREYPWGVIEVDNEEHCDFVKLRQMLIRCGPPPPRFPPNALLTGLERTWRN
jgi:septin 7